MKTAKWKKNYKIWIKNKNLPSYIRTHFESIEQHELKTAFFNELEFGTSGIRAKMGYGSAFFNIINVRRAAMAFSEFLINNFNSEVLKNKGVIIAHDNRQNSSKFTLEIVSVLNYYNIKAIIFNSNKSVPTPLVSYGIKKLKLIAGIAITASHNEWDYNGLKILDENGCQFLPFQTDYISDIYNDNTREAINFNSGALHFSFIEKVNPDLEEKYIVDVLKNQFNPKSIKNIKIIFSNLHGTSKEIMPKIFEKAGYNCFFVKEQYELDEKFTTCPNPNPELDENFELAHKYAKKQKSDLVILNDPDADRVGVSVLHKNNYYIIHANELAPILLTYIFEQKTKSKDKKILKNSIIYSTLVSSNLFEAVANSYNIPVKKTLTGFKWISNEIVKNKNKSNLFSFEESNAFKISDIIYEKDAIQTSLLIAEAVNYYKKNGETFIDIINSIYKKFGFYYCKTISKCFSNENKELYVINIMDILRYSKITSLGDLKIVNKEDYINSVNDNHSENLIKFFFEDGSWMAIRPSGTEPKIKFYFVFINNESMKFAKDQMNIVSNDLFKNYLNI